MENQSVSTQKRCFVCNQIVEDLSHELLYGISRVGLGSIPSSIWVCNKHYADYKKGENLIELHNQYMTRFIRFLNCGVDDYNEFQ